jgi:hypothetical protein
LERGPRVVVRPETDSRGKFDKTRKPNGDDASLRLAFVRTRRVFKVVGWSVAAVILIWLAAMTTLMFRKPEYALFASATSYPGIPAPMAKAFLKYAPYDPTARSFLGQSLFSSASASYELRNADKAWILQVLPILAAKGARVDDRTQGLTPLHGAIFGAALDGDPTLVRLLLTLGADPRLPVEMPGRVVDGMNSLEIARLLAAKHPDNMRELVVLISSQMDRAQSSSGANP